MKLSANRRLTAVFFLFFMMFGITSRAQNREVNENLPDFSELKTSNGIEVKVIPSEENRIEITGHSKHEVKFEVVQTRLEIKLSLNNLWSKDDTRITVYARNLQKIDANQGSLVEVSEELKGAELIFEVQEGASIRAALNAAKVASKAVTGGKLYLTGEAKVQEVELNTGGQLFGKNLKTEETIIKAGTAAKGEIYATQYVRATASLGGTIEIFGSPREVEQKTSLGGRIL